MTVRNRVPIILSELSYLINPLCIPSLHHHLWPPVEPLLTLPGSDALAGPRLAQRPSLPDLGSASPGWAAFLRHPPPVLYHLHDFGTEFLRKGREGKENSRRKGKNERKQGRRHANRDRKGHLQYFSFPCLGCTFAI